MTLHQMAAWLAVLMMAVLLGAMAEVEADLDEYHLAVVEACPAK